jgi:hypothetical protein
LETIEVTFPTIIPKEKIIFILEGNLKQNSKFTCKVKFDRFEDDENVFLVSSDYGVRAFYFIGMTASSIIQTYCN